MDREKLWEKLKQGDEKALEAAIKIYTPYISTIISNVSVGKMSVSDIEDVTADVFYTLWKNSYKIRPQKFKGYITSIAKSKAKNKIRDLKRTESTVNIDNIIIADDNGLSEKIENKDASIILQNAVEELGYPDSEIVVRHYYYYQSTQKIAEAMNMNRETVKSRLKRARIKLKTYLLERGFKNELI